MSNLIQWLRDRARFYLCSGMLLWFACTPEGFAANKKVWHWTASDKQAVRIGGVILGAENHISNQAWLKRALVLKDAVYVQTLLPVGNVIDLVLTKNLPRFELIVRRNLGRKARSSERLIHIDLGEWVTLPNVDKSSDTEFFSTKMAEIFDFSPDFGFLVCFQIKHFGLHQVHLRTLRDYQGLLSELVGFNHLPKLATINHSYQYSYSHSTDLKQYGSIFKPWSFALLGFCIYAYGWGKIESSSYGFVIFIVGLFIFVYGVYRVVRLYFYGF